ncbi:hypothetical protein ACIP93_37680 [Streptomyces sp. NPDC088745]|uniref:hypothetical protein n=1 Tax=Streptomyces sp. NPDC088745 TaxID=3365884 RepID=UPI0038235F87
MASLMASLAPVAFADTTGPGEGASRTVDYPWDTKSNGLEYQYVLPFYQKNGLYVQDVAPTRNLKGDGLPHTLELRERDVEPATQTGVDDGGDLEWNERVQGGMKMLAKSLADKFGGGEILDAILPGKPNVSPKKTVRFDVSDSFTVTPKSQIQARPVYYKLKTVSDIWKRNPGDTHFTVVDRGQVDDAVIGMGWLLMCGGRVCIPGEDYESKAELTVAQRRALEQVPPTGAPDRPAFTRDDVNNWPYNTVPIRIWHPNDCSASTKSDGGWSRGGTVTVRCAKPEDQRGHTFTGYRVEYEHKVKYPAWENPRWGVGTFTEPGETEQDLTNATALLEVRSMPADGQDKSLYFKYLHRRVDTEIIRNLDVRIVPVTDCTDYKTWQPMKPTLAGCGG